MKPSFGFDTSALISLGHSGLTNEIVNGCSIVITSSVHDELIDIGRFDDSDGMAARTWVELFQGKTIVQIEESAPRGPAEDDLAVLCHSRNIPMVTDDLGAMKRHGATVKCLFSVHIVYLLFRKGMISREKAVQSIKRMRNERDWIEEYH